MKTTQKGFGLLAAVLIVAALTAGSFAAVKINHEMHSDNGNGNSEMHATTTASDHATSTGTTTKYIGHEGYLNANEDNNGLMIGASSTLKLGNQ